MIFAISFVKSQCVFLKVSKSRKQVLKFSFEPKNEQKYFCIFALTSKNPKKVVETKDKKKHKKTKRLI